MRGYVFLLLISSIVICNSDVVIYCQPNEGNVWSIHDGDYFSISSGCGSSSIQTQPTQGTLTLISDPYYRYSSGGFVGTTTFTIYVSSSYSSYPGGPGDFNHGSGTETITFFVVPIDPVPQSETVEVSYNSSTSFNLSNWVSSQVGTTSYSITTAPLHGSTLLSGSVVTYNTTNYAGTDNFTYSVQNTNSGGNSNIRRASVTITITPPHVVLSCNSDHTSCSQSCETGYSTCTSSTNCSISLLTSTDNCGSCGSPCTYDNGQAGCSNGSCFLASCDAGFGDCDNDPSNGCEATLDTLINCGSCGTICSYDNAISDCSTQTCELISCTSPFSDCDMNVTNGCEVSLHTVENCGECGTTCNLTNADSTCSTGTCGIQQCTVGFDDCDSNITTGCETSLRTLTDCGSCGSVCEYSEGTSSCTSETCELVTCDSGFDNCDNDPTNGCETPLDTLINCGGCNSSCSFSHASASCSEGKCTLAQCDIGFSNCDSDDTNGCETPLNTLDNCGECGVTCDYANANSSCTTRQCMMGSCLPGFSDCDGLTSNGCETSITTLTDCGACNVTCSVANAYASCSTQQCILSACHSGYSDCDNNSTNGCETSLSTVDTCGTCNGSCILPNANSSCSTRICKLTECYGAFADCDGVVENGCETPISTVDNCGSCGVKCKFANAQASCASGSCAISECFEEFSDCDKNSANGCETLLTTLDNCGACNSSCSFPNAVANCSISAGNATCVLVECNEGFTNVANLCTLEPDNDDTSKQHENKHLGAKIGGAIGGAVGAAAVAAAGIAYFVHRKKRSATEYGRA